MRFSGHRQLNQAIAVAALGVAAMTLKGACPQAAAQTMDNAAVVAMLKAGVPSAAVSTKILASEPDCAIDSSPAGLEQLAHDAVPSDVLTIIAEASCKRASADTGSAWGRIADQLPQTSTASPRPSQCPAATCALVTEVYVDESGSAHLGWFTKNQRSALTDLAKQGKPSGVDTLFLSPDWRDSRYAIVWTQRQGSDTYSYLLPRTTTTTTETRGNVDSVPFDASSTSRTTRMASQTGTRSYVVAEAEVLDTRTGMVLYDSRHVGNFRWSKPDKDAFVDALKWLKSHVAAVP